MRLTASSAIGEIAAAFLPRRALAAMSASSKNCRRACAQQSAGVIAPCGRDGVVQPVVAAIGVGLQDAGEAVKMTLGMLAAGGRARRSRAPPAARGRRTADRRGHRSRCAP